MPTLPSGRRIEFSLDRFHAYLERIGPNASRAVVRHLNEPDDLLFLMDAVHFDIAAGQPYFAGYVATDWAAVAADWPVADRQSLQAWFASPAARETRAEAIDYIRDRVLGESGGRAPYPYWVQDGMDEGLAGPLPRQ